jgi:hypothetical protein
MHIPYNKAMSALIVLIAGMSALQATGMVTGFVSAQPMRQIRPEATNASIRVQPPSASVAAGAFAKFEVNVIASPSANISLVARGVPPYGIAIFTPNAGVANPEFNSSLTIVTSAITPQGNYVVTTVAIVNGTEYATELSLQITASAGVTTSTSTSTSLNSTLATALTLTLDTDQSQYQPNSTVNVQGQVTDATGSAVADATIALQIDGPTGTQLFYTNGLLTDSAGTFHAQVALGPSTLIGTYMVFASASKSGYSSVTTRTTFVVGSSTTPSVIIKAVYAGDSAGNPMSTFTSGQTIWIWVVIQNVGASFRGIVWIQVRDPNGVPVQIQTQVAQLLAGQTIKEGLRFSLPGNALTGVYTVNALVSDKPISQGGTFLASSETQFALTG